MTLDLGNSHRFIEGRLVNNKVANIVAALKEYEPALDVEFIPEGAREEGQAAYRIIFNQPGQPPYVLFHIQKDEDMNESVVARVIKSDQRNGKAELSDLEAWEAAQKLVKQQEWLDRVEEINDMTYHVLRSPKNTYVVNEDLVIKDGTPFNAAESKRRHFTAPRNIEPRTRALKRKMNK